MTTSEARAIAKAIWRHLDAVSGYQPYGWDWRTLRMVYPRMHAVLKACYAVEGVL